MRTCVADSPRFFNVKIIKGTPELTLGTADFVARPIIVLAQEEIIQYVVEHKPSRLVINFQNVGHISSEFISALIRIKDHVDGNGGTMKLSHMNQSVYTPFQLTNLAGRLFMIYDTTPEAIDAF